MIASTADALMLLLVLWGAAAEGWDRSYTALVILSLRGPAIVGGFLGGWGVDRFGAVRVLALDLGARAACACALMWIISGGIHGSWLVVIFSTVAGMTSPACYAATRSLVGGEVAKERQDRAFRWLTAGDQVPFRVSGLLLACAVSMLGLSRSFGPICLLFLAALGLVVATLVGTSGRATDAPADGFVPLRAAGAIGPSLTLSVCFYFVFGAFTSLLPRFATDAFGAGAQIYYGAMLFVFALGWVCGLVAVPWIIRRLGALATPTITTGFGLVLSSALTSPSVAGFMIGYFLAGVAWGPYKAVESTFISRLCSPEARGRAFGAHTALLRTTVPVASALGLFLANHLQARRVLMASALATAATGALAPLAFWFLDLNRRPGLRSEDALMASVR